MENNKYDLEFIDKRDVEYARLRQVMIDEIIAYYGLPGHKLQESQPFGKKMMEEFFKNLNISEDENGN